MVPIQFLIDTSPFLARPRCKMQSPAGTVDFRFEHKSWMRSGTSEGRSHSQEVPVMSQHFEIGIKRALLHWPHDGRTGVSAHGGECSRYIKAAPDRARGRQRRRL